MSTRILYKVFDKNNSFTFTSKLDQGIPLETIASDLARTISKCFEDSLYRNLNPESFREHFDSSYTDTQYDIDVSKLEDTAKFVDYIADIDLFNYTISISYNSSQGLEVSSPIGILQFISLYII